MGRIAVLGAGSWGTALACSLAKQGRDVVLWARREEAAKTLRDTRHNASYLPDVEIPATITVTSDIEAAVEGAWLWVVAVPSQSVRSVTRPLAHLASSEVTVVSVAKGIENETLLTTSGVLRETLPTVPADQIGVLYGPSHAEEVGRERPTTVVASFPDEAVAKQVRDAFMSPTLRVYANTDLIGVEIAGSVKNVMALAAGMGDGLGLGDNAKAATVTRGLAEITRLGLALGADPHTFAGLAGLGDLVVTCFSQHSRNRAFGEKIGAGRSVADALSDSTMVVEGVRTTDSTRQLAERLGVEMPITEAVAHILAGDISPRDAVARLMERDPKLEAAHFDLPPIDGTEA